MNGKTVVITGAGSGIGRALAIEYGKLGARLALNDFNEAGLQETADTLKRANASEPLTAVFDVSDEKSMHDFAQQVKAKWGNAHTVINNAGIAGEDLPGYHISADNYRRVMDINFFGVLYGCQAFLPQLVESNEGAIVNISSTFGLVGVPNCADYCASKFAVRGYTETLAAEFYASPISIHCVHPGGIATNIANNANTPDFKLKYLKTPPEKMARYIIKSVFKKKVKIVYGTDSFRLWLASNIIPQKLQNFLIWTESKNLVDLDKYRSFLKGL